jgi:hypothetical protein
VLFADFHVMLLVMFRAVVIFSQLHFRLCRSSIAGTLRMRPRAQFSVGFCCVASCAQVSVELAKSKPSGGSGIAPVCWLHCNVVEAVLD